MRKFGDNLDRRLTRRCTTRAGVAAVLAGSAVVVMAVGVAGIQLANSPTAVVDPGWASTAEPAYNNLQNAVRNLVVWHGISVTYS